MLPHSGPGRFIFDFRESLWDTETAVQADSTSRRTPRPLSFSFQNGRRERGRSLSSPSFPRARPCSAGVSYVSAKILRPGVISQFGSNAETCFR